MLAGKYNCGQGIFPLEVSLASKQNLIICRSIADFNDHLNEPTHSPCPRRF